MDIHSPGSFLLRIGVIACRAPVDTGLLLDLRFDKDNSAYVLQFDLLTKSEIHLPGARESWAMAMDLVIPSTKPSWVCLT